MTRLLDQWGSRWSFARGATKASHRAKSQSLAELTEALSEVDGLLAGINYLDRLEPESENTYLSSASNDKGSASTPPNPFSANSSWVGHLPFDLPHLDASRSEERSDTELRNLQKILNEKLFNSNDNSRQIPRESQWATLRSLRMASTYHYKQFIKVTADSTSADVRKLRKSYVTAKNMLDMGILTFRNVLHGQVPTTLVDIFAFASLSYVISKTLHSNGHVKKSDILSGILDWRAAIADESEVSAFDEIAKKLWPEATGIMHFYPIKRSKLSPETLSLLPETIGFGSDEGETRFSPLSMAQEYLYTGSSERVEKCISPREDPMLPPRAHENAFIFHENTFPTSSLGEMQADLGGFQDHVYQLSQETGSHEEFKFATFSNFDTALLDDIMYPFLYEGMELGINNEAISAPNTGCSMDAESAPSHMSSPPKGFYEAPPVEQVNLPSDDSILNRLQSTPLFQIVQRFVLKLSELGDLLTVLSGRELISTAHSRPSWVTFEFLDQATRHFFGNLYRDATKIDDIFNGIVAMAESIVRLGSLHTVREVEIYIITVGRCLARSHEEFMRLVSETLNQCLFASRNMKWYLLYPKHVQEAEEYNHGYIKSRIRGEKEWAHSEFARLARQGQKPPFNLPINMEPSPNPAKLASKDTLDSVSSRRRYIPPKSFSQNPLSESNLSTVAHCTFNECSKSFKGISARNNLSRHIRAEHRMVRLRCPVCGMETARRDNLRQHFKNVHSTYELPRWIAERRRGLRNESRT